MPTLPEIIELSSIEEEDIEESFHLLTNSRMPVSPQTTAPLFKPQKIDEHAL